MRLRNAWQISLTALCVTIVPTATFAAAPAAPTATLDVSAVTGATAIRVAGTAGGSAHLQAELYAAFAPDLPIAFLSRQSLQTDAAGRFDAILSLAPAYFDGTLITVIVRNAAGNIVGRGSIRIGDPDAG